MIKNFIFKYGFYTVLFLVLAGLYFIAERIEIRNKTAVNVVAVGSQIRIYAPIGSFSSSVGDSLTVEQTAIGVLRLKIDEIKDEPMATVYVSECCNPVILQGNTFFSGYVFTNKVNLKNLIIDKIR